MIRRLDGWGFVLFLMGAGFLANAVWMLAGPMHWYQELPAAVPDTGPFNPHFVRDIGCAFLAVGAAVVWGAFDPGVRRPLLRVAALFLVAHALLHVYDTAVGNLPHSHWWLDLGGVYLPAFVLGFAALSARVHEGGPHATRAD